MSRNIFTNASIMEQYYLSSAQPTCSGNMDLNNFDLLNANTINANTINITADEGIVGGNDAYLNLGIVGTDVIFNRTNNAALNIATVGDQNILIAGGVGVLDVHRNIAMNSKNILNTQDIHANRMMSENICFIKEKTSGAVQVGNNTSEVITYDTSIHTHGSSITEVAGEFNVAIPGIYLVAWNVTNNTLASYKTWVSVGSSDTGPTIKRYGYNADTLDSADHSAIIRIATANEKFYVHIGSDNSYTVPKSSDNRDLMRISISRLA